MAVFTEKAFNEAGSPGLYHPTAGGYQFLIRTVSRTYGADTIKLLRLPRDTKIGFSFIAATAALGGAAAATLRLNNGTTQVDLIVGASLVAANAITTANRSAALGHVIPANGYWLEVLFTVVAAAPGSVIVGVDLSWVMFGDESPIRPLG